jgi:hypothetical protein
MKLLVAIGAVLVIGAVALVLLMSKTGDPAPIAQKSVARPGEGSSVRVTSTERGAPPVLPNGSAVAAAGSDQVREYMVGDVKIRDHRTGDHKPMDIPPNIHPANGRALPTELTQEISQQVKRQLFACAKDLLPKEARGTKPKLEGTLSVAIKDHKLSVTGLESQIRDVDGPSASALKQCVEEKSAAFTSSAPKEADLDNYTIGLTFAIP